MEEESVRVIRETTRNLLKVNRQVHKHELADVRRSIETRITPVKVADIANRLKNKTAVSLFELHTLKNILIEDEKNINIVLSSHGSLRGLVRELSGQDVRRQCAAAGCICNLALGDSKACMAIAKAAGPYLVMALDNLSTELAVTCAWALGNAAGAGRRAGAALSACGACARLCAARARGPERRAAAQYALLHFATQMRDEFSKEYIEQIIEAYPKLDLDMTSSQLLFTISCHEEFNLHHDMVLKLLDATAVSTEKHINACTGTEICCSLTYLLRTLANVSVTKVNCDFVVHYLIQKQLLVYFNRILANDNSTVKESLLWLLGNLFNFCSDNGFIKELLS
ncbi:hypothetical protein ABMA28_017131 [Loxostege sticticalis]|uniref:Armadillo repeat-containing protein 8 n=1 Tax=Loxostege sticticalis TaxID=481309 RepID=A0ABD0T721_LOXSC